MTSIEYVPELYKKYVGPSANTIFDIGSRDGNDANHLSNELDAKNVYIFECHPTCFYRIKEKYPNFKNIKIAVSNYTGSSSFNAVMTDDIELGVSSLKDRNDDWYTSRNVEKVTVQVDTIFNLINKHKIQIPIDLVKIDVEGCSYEVLEGFSSYIKEVKMFHIEVEEFQIWENQKVAEDVSQLMEKNDFVLVDNRYFGERVSDQLWVNKRFILSDSF